MGVLPDPAELGRFRNAMVLDELAKRPTDSLQRFVTINRLMFKTLRATNAGRMSRRNDEG